MDMVYSLENTVNFFRTMTEMVTISYTYLHISVCWLKENSPALWVVSTEEGDLQPEFLRSTVRASWRHALVESLKDDASRDDIGPLVLSRRWGDTGELRITTNLFVSLFPATQPRPVVVPKAEKIIVGDQALNRVPYYIDVHGLLGSTVPEYAQMERKFII